MIKNYTQYIKINENTKILAGTLFKYYTFGNIRRMLLGKKIIVWDEYGIIIPDLKNIYVTDVYKGKWNTVVEINNGLFYFEHRDDWTIEIIEPKREFSDRDPLGEEDWDN